MRPLLLSVTLIAGVSLGITESAYSDQLIRYEHDQYVSQAQEAPQLTAQTEIQAEEVPASALGRFKAIFKTRFRSSSALTSKVEKTAHHPIHQPILHDH